MTTGVHPVDAKVRLDVVESCPVGAVCWSDALAPPGATVRVFVGERSLRDRPAGDGLARGAIVLEVHGEAARR